MLLSRLGASWLPVGHRIGLVTLVALGYIGLALMLTWQALRGEPLLAPDVLTLATLGLVAGTLVLAAGAVAAHARLASAQPRVALRGV